MRMSMQQCNFGDTCTRYTSKTWSQCLICGLLICLRLFWFGMCVNCNYWKGTDNYLVKMIGRILLSGKGKHFVNGLSFGLNMSKIKLVKEWGEIHETWLEWWVCCSARHSLFRWKSWCSKSQSRARTSLIALLDMVNLDKHSF